MEYEYKTYIQKQLTILEKLVYLLFKKYTCKIYKIGNQRSFEFIYNSETTHELKEKNKKCDNHTLKRRKSKWKNGLA